MKDKWLAPFLVSGLLVGVAGCPDVDVDPGEGVDDTIASGPIVEFDPSNRIVPFPNNLLLDRTTGKVNLPASCNESPASMATRVGVLNKLDGFGTFETVMTVTFTEAVDIATVAGNVSLFKRATGATEVDPTTAMAIPVVAVPSMTARFDADCMNPVMVTQVILVPTRPLDQKSTYVVALKSGIKTSMGADFGPSFTWSLIRQEAPLVELDAMGNVISDRTPLDPSIPEDLASLQGIDLLWKAHAKAMTFLRGANVPTESVVLAWEFNTQTVTDQLDPAVAGSPAAQAATTPALAGIARVNAAANGEAFLRAALPANSCSADGGPLPCQAVAEALGGGLLAKQFQVPGPNPLAGGTMIPGMWSDPINPTVVAGTPPLGVFITTTALGCNAGTTGCPTVVFGHGLGSNRNTLAAIAAQFASIGYNAVAIDFQAHGSRAIRVSNTGACADMVGPPATPSPGLTPQCYAPFLSPNLGATRDNIRQSVVDMHSLVAALKACGPANCGLLKVDPARILYAGISLGGIMGSTVTSTNPDIKAAVLNVPGVGWVDILENTQSAPIKCSLVDGLIDAGILTGDKSSAGASALCLTEAWKTQPGYRQFSAIGRWILDPADPANFTRKLAAKKFLIQEVVGDLVVANVTTRNEGALTGLLTAQTPPLQADCGVPVGAPPAIAPSAAITAGATATGTPNKYVQYTTTAPGSATCAPGNTFAHSSLLAPAAATQAGSLGTARVQTDALTFLSLND